MPANLTMNDLEIALEIGGAVGGRRKAALGPLQFDFVRELNAGDLELILNPPPMGTKQTPLQSLRTTHHMLARLLAEGKSQVECSMITGHSQVRISVLKQDPMFQELIAHYKVQVEEQYLDTHRRLAALGMATLEELMERLEVEPGKFTNKELFELAELTLDRSVTPQARKSGPAPGAPGTGSGVTINLNFPQPPKHQLQEGEAPVIDLTPEP